MTNLVFFLMIVRYFAVAYGIDWLDECISLYLENRESINICIVKAMAYFRSLISKVTDLNDNINSNPL